MSNRSNKNAKADCPTDDLAAYIDGELAVRREVELEDHLARCANCSTELNRQKQFLCALDLGLRRDGEVDLPPNFTKLIVANAESTVSGLRRPGERYNALFICSALFLFILFALGSDAGRVLDRLSAVLEQTAIVGGFFGHLIYTFFLGIGIVLRALASQILLDRAASGMLMVGLITVTFFLMRRVLVILRRV
jgi:hypothetical protein